MPNDGGGVWWRFAFPEGVQSTSWGLWTDVCDSFCRGLIGLVEWICQMFPLLLFHTVLDVMRMIRTKTMNSIRNSKGSWCQAQCQVWYAFVTEEMHCSSKWSFLSVNAACLHISNECSPAEKPWIMETRSSPARVSQSLLTNGKKCFLQRLPWENLASVANPKAHLNYETSTPLVEIHHPARHSALKWQALRDAFLSPIYLTSVLLGFNQRLFFHCRVGGSSVCIYREI